MWPTVRDKARLRSRTRGDAGGATVRALEDNTLVLTHESALAGDCPGGGADVLAEALKDARWESNWRVRCETGEPAAASQSAGGERGDCQGQTCPHSEFHSARDEGHMLAEAGRGDPSPRRDPEEVARLLQN